MFRASVLTLLLLFVQLSQPLSFDIVVGSGRQLDFYYNGTLTHTEIIPSANEIHSVTYDPVQYRVLFADFNQQMLIYTFDISTKKTQYLLKRTDKAYYLRIVYDPVSQVLYWGAGRGIYSYTLNPATTNKEVDGKLLITLDHVCFGLAVDSCGGYIYWITDKEIERARLDGSEREVLIDADYYRPSLAIDQRTQEIYWTNKNVKNDDHMSIESASFNGKRRTTLYILRNAGHVHSLAVSKDFIYWHDYNQGGLWQLPKNQKHLQAIKLYSMFQTRCLACYQIAVNYTLKEQTEGVKSCDGLRGLIPNDSKSASTVSICQNYCFQGECSVSAEGRPTCSCKAGYSGERCEINACHDYCLQGNCSLDAAGQPKCSCMTGYSGERCEVNACHGYCLNGGVCSLNEEDEPACQCTVDYDGVRCEVSAYKDNSCDAGSSGEGQVSVCRQFCLNDGVCSLDEASEPVCQCTADYAGDRCDIPAFMAKWVLHAYKDVAPVTRSNAVKTTELVRNEHEMRSR